MKTPYFHTVAALATMAGITFAAEGSSGPPPHAETPDPGTAFQDADHGFPGDGTVTRAEAVKIAVLIRHGKPQECTGKTFSDVTPEIGRDLCGYVEAGAKLGIVSPARKFRPADPVTRAEMEKMFLIQ